MKTRVWKWGNGLALRIPKSLATGAGLERDTEVEMLLEERKLVITPVVKRKLALKQLLTKISEENLHHEVNTGSAVGNEVW